jgi:anti-sigma factor RsiW
MPVSDQDLEQLDAYLDDALDVPEVDALRARVERDPDLAAALEQARRERATRKSLFAALEPDDATVTTLINNVRREIKRHHRTTTFARPVRLLGALAACLAIGFFSRGLFDRPRADQPLAQDKNVTVQPVTQYQVTLRDDAGKIVAVQRFDSLDKAQAFAADLARWQARSENLAAGRFVLTADRF